MKTMIGLIALCLLLLLLVQNVQAGSSTDYRIDWTNLLTGSGGTASSADYQVSLTVGQTAVGTSKNSSYHVYLGYWQGIIPPYSFFLPKVNK